MVELFLRWTEPTFEKGRRLGRKFMKILHHHSKNAGKAILANFAVGIVRSIHESKVSNLFTPGKEPGWQLLLKI